MSYINMLYADDRIPFSNASAPVADLVSRSQDMIQRLQVLRYLSGVQRGHHDYDDIYGDDDMYPDSDIELDLEQDPGSEQEASTMSDTVLNQVLRNLKTIKFSSKTNTQTECPFTLERFKDGDLVVELPCGHIFDSESIKYNIALGNTRCPMCRADINNKS